jgi:hypothetical protein
MMTHVAILTAGVYFRHVERKRLLYQNEQAGARSSQKERSPRRSSLSQVKFNCACPEGIASLESAMRLGQMPGFIPPATENCFAKVHRQNPERGGWLGGCGTLGNSSQEAPSVWTENLQIVPSSQTTMYWLFVQEEIANGFLSMADL